MFSLSLEDNLFDTLAGSMLFPKPGAISAYWQVGIKEEDGKTAFISKYG